MPAVQRFRLASLSDPPNFLLIGDGWITLERAEWVQPVDLWTAIYYHHANVVSIDGTSFKADPDTVVIFPPGCRGTHAVLDDGTYHHCVSFNLPGQQGERLAIPLINEDMAAYYPSLRRAAIRVTENARPSLAWIWNFMWAIAQNTAVFRHREDLYAAEDWIYRHLRDKFTVPELAEAVGASPRHLLRAFRTEHGVSIQEFIRQKRVQEATRLLATTDRPVKEIAARIGIPDLQAFNKAIRQETGSSPTAFREISIQRGIAPPRP